MLISGQESASELYPKGHYHSRDTMGMKSDDRTLDIMRRLAESCSNFQGFLITHSIAGGTGSRFTSRLQERLEIEFSKKVQARF